MIMIMMIMVIMVMMMMMMKGDDKVFCNFLSFKILHINMKHENQLRHTVQNDGIIIISKWNHLLGYYK